MITGPSGSGKTTLSNDILKNLDNSHLISTDDYYRTDLFSKIASKLYRSYFDNLISLNKKRLIDDINYIFKYKKINHYYKYDFKNKTSIKIYKKFINIENLIIEGIFTLDLLDVVSKNNFLLVKLDLNKDTCKERIFKRDLLDRGKNKNKIYNNFNNAWEIYIKKEKNYKSISKKRELIIRKDISSKIVIDKLFKLNQ